VLNAYLNISCFPQLFDIIKRDRAQNLKKIVPLSGDCAALGLGLSTSDRQLLEEKVSVVFHAAASVRFDDPLKSAVLLNTRGTREVMMIARGMKNLKVSFKCQRGIITVLFDNYVTYNADLDTRSKIL
jgi:thioester reductase-like protein